MAVSVFRDDGIGYHVHEGNIRRESQKLYKQGLQVLSTADIMIQRLFSSRDLWTSNYFHTSDVLLLHPDGKFKFVHDGLQNLPNRSMWGAEYVLRSGEYESAEGEEFNRGQISSLGRDLSLAEAVSNVLWINASRSPTFASREKALDSRLLDAFAGDTFRKGENIYGYEKMMGVNIGFPSKTAVARAAYVYGLEGRSRLVGRYYLGDDVGRLVGVAPEALAQMRAGLSARLDVYFERQRRSINDRVQEQLRTQGVIEQRRGEAQGEREQIGANEKEKGEVYDHIPLEVEPRCDPSKFNGVDAPVIPLDLK